MAHGVFPVPPPAVAEILAGVPIYSTAISGELVTPTGAAIIKTVCESYGPLPQMRVERTGYGAGTREYENFPNALRLMLGDDDAQAAATSERLLVIETNIDDMSPQLFGYVMERAFSGGALDCYLTPVQMKKNRPGVLLTILCRQQEREAATTASVEPTVDSEKLLMIETNVDDTTPQVLGYVLERAFALGALDCFLTPVQMKKNRPGALVSILCRPAEQEALTQLLFDETTTLGVRSYEVVRRALEREFVSVETEFGAISVKVAQRDGRVSNAAPEFEDCRAAALRAGVPLQVVERAARADRRDGRDNNYGRSGGR
jgi:uncharacterized protein (DUF111 family)